MSRFLKDVHDLEALKKAVAKCEGNVLLRSSDGTEEFNMKSKLSEYVALGKLASECGENYEVFCSNRNDEAYLLKFFYEHNKI